MTECIDNRLGVLLLPYELGLASKEEAEQFECHLLECSYCHEQLTSFEPYASLLRSGRVVPREARESGKPRASQLSILARLRQHLWPPVVLPLRPAVLLAVIALLLYPTVMWIDGRHGEEDGPTAVLVLSTTRSAARNEVATGSNGLVISLPRPDGNPSQGYVVRVTNEQSQLIYEDPTPRAFDEDGWRHLLFKKGLPPGNYRLSVTPLENKTRDVAADYWFSVK